MSAEYWYDDGRNAWYEDGRNAVYYVDERNAAFGDEWRNDYYRRVWNPRTRRYEQQLVRSPAGQPPGPGAPAPHPMAMPPAPPRPLPAPMPAPALMPMHHPMHHAAPVAAGAAAGNVTCGPSPFKNEFGQVRTGLIIDAIAQSLAAFAPLPAPPPPSDDVNTNQQNSITYLAALAAHAKRDEQVRTVSKLVQLFVRS
jgi:hypothetical protein